MSTQLKNILSRELTYFKNETLMRHNSSIKTDIIGGMLSYLSLLNITFAMKDYIKSKFFYYLLVGTNFTIAVFFSVLIFVKKYMQTEIS